MKKLIPILLCLALAFVSAAGFAAVEEGAQFSWNGHDLRISEISFGDDVDAGSETAVGEFVQLVISCDEKTMIFSDTSDLNERITLAGADGTQYPPVSVWGTLAESVSFDQISTAKISALTVLFDLPQASAIDTYALMIDGQSVTGESKEQAEGEISPDIVGDWRLATIGFKTPLENDIFTIDAGMTVNLDAKNSSLSLKADGTIVSDVDLDGLSRAVPQLPFETNGLDFSKYASWSCQGGAFVIAPDGVPLTWAYNETTGELNIYWADEVEILSQQTDVGTSKSGGVLMQITMTFVPAGSDAQSPDDEVQDEAPEPTPEPTPAPGPSSSKAEKFLDALVKEQAEAEKDEWARAILLHGVWYTDWEDDQIRFFLRSFDPHLADLGDYDAGKDDYLTRMYDYVIENDLECVLPATFEDGEFHVKDADFKALLKTVKDAASKAKSAFDDKRVRIAIADYMLNAQTIFEHFNFYYDEEIYVPLLATQTKQSLDVSGGPYALKLKCTAADGVKLVDKAYAAAIEKLSKKAYANQMENHEIEEVFREELASQAEAFKKKGTESFVFTFDFTALIEYDSPGDEFYSYIEAYEQYYSEKLEELSARVYNMPDMPALDFPPSGRISGKSSGTLINFKIPSDGMARYIQMREVDSDEAVVSAFIRPGGKTSVRVPKGDYYILVGIGDTWYGEEYLFGENAIYSRTEDLEVMSSNYYHTITLGGATEGNMESYGADLSDFM